MASVGDGVAGRLAAVQIALTSFTVIELRFPAVSWMDRKTLSTPTSADPPGAEEVPDGPGALELDEAHAAIPLSAISAMPPAAITLPQPAIFRRMMSLRNTARLGRAQGILQTINPRSGRIQDRAGRRRHLPVMKPIAAASTTAL
jgi:hypothetical protein